MAQCDHVGQAMSGDSGDPALRRATYQSAREVLTAAKGGLVWLPLTQFETPS